MIKFKRIQRTHPLSADDRTILLSNYFEYYSNTYNSIKGEKGEGFALELLNVKMPNTILNYAINQIANEFQKQLNDLVLNSDVQLFLQENPLPEPLTNLLPPEVRIYSLLMNSLKNWVSAEQPYTDKYLLGGNARKRCRTAAVNCIVTNTELAFGEIELHHIIRDGSPPIPLSKEGHRIVEKYREDKLTSGLSEKYPELTKEKKKRKASWVMLRNGCNSLISSDHIAKSSERTWAKKAAEITGLSYVDLLSLL